MIVAIFRLFNAMKTTFEINQFTHPFAFILKNEANSIRVFTMNKHFPLMNYPSWGILKLMAPKSIASPENHKSIVVGTANFRQVYGINKTTMSVGESDSRLILSEVANRSGMLVDSANSYGDIEKFIGVNFANRFNSRITTKILFPPDATEEKVVQMIEISLSRMSQTSFAAVLVHNPEILLMPNGKKIAIGLQRAVEKGLTKRIGASCYSSSELIILSTEYPMLNSFQLNSNVAFRIDKNNDALVKMSNSNIYIYVRSIFLQGLLLLPVDKVPAHLEGLTEVVTEIEKHCENEQISKLSYCLDYARSLEWATGIVVGVDSHENFIQILKESEKSIQSTKFPTPEISTAISDPRKWSV
jgi:aryl-alcohol dehydrogenase-like predicted oxidoreductase